jgi:hypothetical protein
MIRTVHVFQCGSADLYGVTQDQTGANLPIDECKEGWRFLKTVEMDEGLPPRGMAVAWQERDAAVRAAIAENGLFSWRGCSLAGGNRIGRINILDRRHTPWAA